MTQRILVADDSPTIQKVIKIALSRHDVKIEETSTFAETIGAIGRLRPQVLIMDASLEGIEQPEDFKRVLQELQGAELIALMGSFDTFDEGTLKTYGVRSFLKKPFESQDIIQLVEKALNFVTPSLNLDIPDIKPKTPPLPVHLGDAQDREPPRPKAPPKKEDNQVQKGWEEFLNTRKPSLDLHPDEKQSPPSAPVIPPKEAPSKALQGDDMIQILRETILGYCQQHFPQLCRTIILEEIKRLTDEKEKLLNQGKKTS